jgi:hypothetical protein
MYGVCVVEVEVEEEVKVEVEMEVEVEVGSSLACSKLQGCSFSSLLFPHLRVPTCPISMSRVSSAGSFFGDEWGVVSSTPRSCCCRVCP